MAQTCNDSITISVPSNLLNLIHNKLVTKSSVKQLPDGRKWWLQCYPAGNAENRKDALILVLRLTGGPASVSTRVSIKDTTFSCDQQFEIKEENDHNTVLCLEHDSQALKSIKIIEIDVHATFYFGNVNSEAVLPALSDGFVLTEAQINAAKIGECRSTPKYDVPDIPGLQWWLDCYPNGNSGKQAKTVMIFLRVSMAPVNVNLTYSINNATITVVSGRKTEKIIRPGAIRDIVQLKHDNPKFKDAFVNGILTFVCVPSFTMPTKKVVPPPLSVATNSVTGSTSALNSQELSSISIDKVKTDEPIATTMPANPPSRLSAKVVLTKVDMSSTAMGTCISTPKYDVPNIPGLQWWLDCYPNGNGDTTSKTLMVAMRVSMAPMNVTLKYSFLNATKSVFNGNKMFSFTSVDELHYIVKMKQENSNFKDCFVTGTITFNCVPTFTVPTGEVVSLSSATQSVSGSTSSLISQPISRSSSIQSVAEPKLTSIPKKVVDSCTVHLTKADLLASNTNKLRTTPKRSFPDVPGLQWWLEYYPAGNSVNDCKRVIILIRASCAPITMTATYYIPQTAVRCELTQTIKRVASRGFNYVIPHVKLVFDATESSKICCDVTITVPNKLVRQLKLLSVIPKPVPVAALPLKPFTVKLPTTVTDSTSIVLNEKVDLHQMIAGKSMTTPKRCISQVRNLEWWLEVLPAGNSLMDTVVWRAFIHVSVAPVDITAVYSYAGTEIKRQIPFKFMSTATRGANFSVTHQELLDAEAFANGVATLNCTVVFNSSQVQSQLTKAAESTPVTQEKPTPVAVVYPMSSQPIGQPSRTTHTLKFNAKREHFTNPSYVITTPKRKIQDDIEWFVTSTPGGKDVDGNGCLTVYLNASTNVSGNVKYEVEGTHLRGTMAFKDSALIQIKQILHTDFDAYPLVRQFDIKIVATLGSSSRSDTPTTLSGSAESDSSEWTSTDDEEDDLESGMTDKELLLHRLKMQEEETNKVLELLKRVKPVLIADGEDFL